MKKETKRTAKETAGLIEKTCNNVNRIIDVMPFLKESLPFIKNSYFENLISEKIKKECELNELSENHIRTILFGKSLKS